MTLRRGCRLALAGALALLATMPVRAGQGNAQNSAAVAAGERAVQAKCLGCHGPELIQQQRLSRAGWVRELEKMERWGATLAADEKSAAADYLALDFGYAARGTSATSQVLVSSAGRAVLERRCLSCHERDIIAQQRLSSSGWTREVDKMVRWGAVVVDAERDDLLRYLTDAYGSTR